MHNMIGTDIVDIHRIKLLPAFTARILNEDEQNEFNQLTSEKRQKEYLAGRFAAKEAIFKITQDPHYLQYSILHQKNGCPYIKGHPEFSISIAHDAGIAIAVVIRSDPA